MVRVALPDSLRTTSAGVCPAPSMSTESVERPVSTVEPNTAAPAGPASKFSTLPRSV